MLWKTTNSLQKEAATMAVAIMDTMDTTMGIMDTIMDITDTTDTTGIITGNMLIIILGGIMTNILVGIIATTIIGTTITTRHTIGIGMAMVELSGEIIQVISMTPIITII